MMQAKRLNLRPSLRLLILTTSLILFSAAIAAGQSVELSPADGNGVFACLRLTAWSPYIAGAGIGVVSWFAFLLSNHPLGVSTAFAKTSGLIEKSLRGENALQKDYYQRFVPEIDWEWMLVLGLFLGAFLSAILSGDFEVKFNPETWRLHVGENVIWRWLVAFTGGILIGLGARWANGCTSGHALSGTMQLVLSSWVAALGIFLGGIVAAMVIF